MQILRQAISIAELKGQGNPSRDVEDPEIREAIKAIVDKFITA